MSNYGWLKTLLMFVIAFAVQSTIGDWLKILGVGPDFILIFIVSVALRFGAGTGCFWGFLAGFSLDVYAPVEWLGANTIAMTIVGFAVGQLEEHFLTLNLPPKVGVLGLAFYVNDMFYFLISYWRYFVLPHFGEEVGCITILRRTRREFVGIGTS